MQEGKIHNKNKMRIPVSLGSGGGYLYLWVKTRLSNAGRKDS